MPYKQALYLARNLNRYALLLFKSNNCRRPPYSTVGVNNNGKILALVARPNNSESSDSDI